MHVSRKCLALALLLGSAVTAQDSQSALPTPVSNEVNSQLPRWLRFGGEERVRTEYITGEGFKSVTDLYLLNRLRLNLRFLPLAWLTFTFQAEDSRVFGQNTLPAPASQKNAMDLRLGYVQVGKDEGPAVLRAGRQSLEFGEGRLLADPMWSNVGKSFDAARVTLHRGDWKVDLFSAASVKIDPVSFDQPTPGEHFDGIYGSVGKLIPSATLEPYLFWRMEHNYKSETGKAGNLDEKTLGFRWFGKLPGGFDYTVELAGQGGSWAGDRIAAWAGHWVVGHSLADSRHRPRIFAEFARASGDADAKDGTHGTFDSLFPSSHDKFGLTDLLCASNVFYLRSGLQYTVRRGFTLSAAYNDDWLANAKDGLYSSSKIIARSVNGVAGTHIGQEGDVQAQWTVSGATQLTVGYGRLFPGEFLKQTTSGVPYDILFLNVAQRF